MQQILISQRSTKDDIDGLKVDMEAKVDGLKDEMKDNMDDQAVLDHIKHQQQFLQLLKDNLSLVHNQMKQQADQHCSKRIFGVDNWVFLRLQPYKQMSLKQYKKDDKLSPNYYVPYKVLQKLVLWHTNWSFLHLPKCA